MQLESNFLPGPHPNTSLRTLYKGFVTLTEETLPTSKGSYPYITIHTRPLSVIVIPLRSDGTILVTKEWRHSVKRYVYSFPGGLVDEGETPLQASRRELLEETGYGTEKTTLLGSCFPLPGLLQQTMSIIVAHDIHQICEPHKDPIEEISFDFYSMGDLQAKFRDSSDIDAMGLAAMALFWINVSPN